PHDRPRAGHLPLHLQLTGQHGLRWPAQSQHWLGPGCAELAVHGFRVAVVHCLGSQRAALLPAREPIVHKHLHTTRSGPPGRFAFCPCLCLSCCHPRRGSAFASAFAFAFAFAFLVVIPAGDLLLLLLLPLPLPLPLPYSLFPIHYSLFTPANMLQ